MNIDKILNNKTITAFAIFAVIAVYYLILTTLKQGISCDEGFYLMGYQHSQPLGSFISDYANIVRSITSQALEGDIMVYRYERLIAFILSILLFAHSLYGWLKQKYNLSINKILFLSLVLLAGAMSYTFATPSISYDSIQTVIYLLSFSFFFLSATSKSVNLKTVFLLLSGAVSIIGVLNYFPSGLFLIFTLGVFIFIETAPKSLKSIGIYVLGIIIGLILYHFLVRDLIEYAQLSINVIIGAFTEKSPSGHDSGGLIKSFAVKFGLFLIYVPGIYLFSILIKKTKIPTLILYAVLLLALFFLLIYRPLYSFYSPIFFLPVAFVFAGILSENTFATHLNTNKKELIIISLLIVLPFLAVFGTNQNLFAKSLIFMPFWLIVFFILLSKLRNQQIQLSAILLMTVILFAGYIYLGNFSRYHYYYTPRSSRYPIENVLNTQAVTISKFQQEYYRELADSLKTNGAQEGDKYLAFGENQMIVFLMNGTISGNLPYHWFQYIDFPDEAPKFFVLFKNEEQEVIDLLKDTNWMFPIDYHRMEMRAMSENMDQEELKTVVYARKKSITLNITPNP